MNQSISRRVNGERLVLLGWPRAILLQMAHPLIAAGVAQHSSFRSSPLTAVRRLRETVRAMLRLTFGTQDDHARVIAGIAAIHRRVHGSLSTDVGVFPSGTRYSAEDPALVLWVHATVVESTVLAYEAVIAALTAAERDAYCREAAVVATELGANPDHVPRTWDGLLAYIASVHASGVLAAGNDGLAVGRAVLSGPWPRLGRPLSWVNGLITAGWLPADVRRGYGLSWDDRHDRRHESLLAALRLARRFMPALVATWPEARKRGQSPF